MKSLQRLTPLLLLLAALALVPRAQAQITPPAVSYLQPDIGTPGMNTYVEVIAPYNYFGKFGSADGLWPQTTLEIKCVRPADTNRLIISFGVVSWGGRLISCQFFVKPGAALGPIPIQVRYGNQVSNTDTFYVVAPQPMGILSGGGALGSTFGTRSRRGAMIVDSLILTNGTYTVSTTDCDPISTGNQAYLPFTLISKGRVVVTNSATINVNSTGKNGGPGGGGGGGYGGGSSIPGETDAPLGDGYTGGKSLIGLFPANTATFGTGSLANSKSLDSNFAATRNVTMVLTPPIQVQIPVVHAGTGHPFDADNSGISGINDISGGGIAMNVASGGPVLGIGGGGNATAGTGTGNSSIDGQKVGNSHIVPLHGGGGGASGGTCDYVGGGGGGGISLYSQSSASFYDVEAKGGDGKNGAASGTGVCANTFNQSPPGFRGEGSAGGAGGCIIVGAKRGLQVSQAAVDGGTGGLSSNGNRAGNGGVGRLRTDGRLIGPVSATANSSQYAGPTLDTLTYADSLFWNVNGTGRPGDSIQIYVRSNNQTWASSPNTTAQVANDSSWTARIRFPVDTIAYIFVLQSTPNSDTVGETQYTNVPRFTFSQAGASIVKLNLIARIVSLQTVVMDSMLCPADVAGNVTITNTGTIPLAIGSGSMFTGPNAQYFHLLANLPDSIAPGQSKIYSFRFDGQTAPNGNLSTVLSLYTNDQRYNPYNIAISVVKAGQKFGVTPIDIDMGGVVVGAFKDTSVTYTNLNTYRDSVAGVVPINGIQAILLHDAVPFPWRQAPGGTHVTGFRFTPTDTGAFIGKFRLLAEPCDHDTLITIRGYGRSPIVHSDKFVDFPNLACADTTTERLVVTNTGNMDLQLQYPTIIGQDKDSFSVISPAPGTFPRRVVVGDSVVILVHVKTTASKILSAQLSFQSNDGLPRHNPWLVDLNAIRDAASLGTRDSVIDFGTVCVGGSLTRLFTVSNLSDQSQVTLSYTTRADSNLPYGVVGLSFPQYVPARDSLPIALRYTPLTAGNFTDTLYLHSMPCDKLLRIIVKGTAAGSRATPDQNVVDFADVRVGTPTQHVLVITNPNTPGALPITITKLRLGHPEPQVSIVYPTIPPARTLAPGDTMQVTLQYQPSAAARLNTDTVLADYSTPCPGIIAVPVLGNGIISSVATSKSTITLATGLCTNDSIAIDTLTVSNFGTAALDITGITPSPAGTFTVLSPATPFTLAPGNKQIVKVQYTAGAASINAVSGTLTFTTTDPQRPTFSVNISARHDSVGVSLSESLLHFPTLPDCQNNATMPLVLHNSGTVPDTIHVQPPAPFSISPTNIFILAPGRDTVITISFQPQVNGNFTGSLMVNAGPCGISKTVELQGARTAVNASVSALDFADVPVSTAGNGSATITNSGVFGLRVLGATISPANSDIVVIAGQFPMVIPPGGSAKVNLTFTPSAPGTLPSGTVLKLQYDSACTGELVSEVSGNGILGSIGLNKRAIDYGKVLGCQGPLDSIALRNLGNIPFAITGMSVTPPAMAAYYQIISGGTTPRTVLPGDSAVVVIRMNPSTAPNGAVSGTLTVMTDDKDRAQIDIPLNAARINESLKLSGQPFAVQTLGTSTQQTYWLVNNGTAPLTVNTATLAAPFTIKSIGGSLPITLAPGDSVQVVVEFAPVVGAIYTDTLAMSTTAKCPPLAPLTINGEGEGAAAATITLPAIDAVPGEHLSIPINLATSAQLDLVGAHDYSVTLRFIKSVLLPEGESPIGVVQGNYREVTLSGTRPMGTATGNIGTLQVIAALGDTLVTPIEITSFDWSGVHVSMTMNNGSVTVHPKGGWKLFVGKGETNLAAPIPDPTAGMVTLKYETTEIGRIQIYLTDVLGRKVQTLLDDNVAPAPYGLIFDAAQLNSGLYYIVLQTPSIRQVQPLHVVK